MNKKYFDISFWMLLGLVASIIACSDPAADERREEEQRVADSTAQALSDQEALDDYIENRITTKGDFALSDIDTLDFNIRYVVIEEGEGRVIEPNDIYSVEYLGKLVDSKVFDTNNLRWAITNDSINYVNSLTDFPSILAHFKNDVTSTLDSAQDRVVLDFTLYQAGRAYAPYRFNYIPRGDNVTGFVTGFVLGIRNLIPKLKKGGYGEVYIPSAVAYGTTGNVNIPGNTPLIFELHLVDVKPD